MLSKLNFKAILVGWLAYYGLFYVVIAPLAIGLALALNPFLFAGGRHPTHLAAHLIAALPYRVALLAAAALAKMTAAFVTAHLGKAAPLQNALALGVLITLGSLLIRSINPSSASIYGPLSVLSTLPFALLGAYWRMRTRKPDTGAAEAPPGPPPPIPLP